jgi:hypothetical protein
MVSLYLGVPCGNGLVSVRIEGARVARTYEVAKPPRFRIELTTRGERIRIQARRRVFPLFFLPLWLALWTIGGVAAIADLIRTHEPFLVVWLGFWAVGWLGAAAILAWMFWGAELLAVVGGDLEIGETIAGFTRVRLYRGGDIRGLAAAEAPPFYAQFQFSLPFVMRARSGAVKFHYGARTVYAAQGLDEAEGRMIVGHLARRLPRQAATTDRSAMRRPVKLPATRSAPEPALIAFEDSTCSCQ